MTSSSCATGTPITSWRAEQAEPQLTGSEQAMCLERVDDDQDNVRTAHAWSVGQREGEIGIRLANALWRFWWIRGHIGEGRGWFEQLLPLSTGVEAVHRARALNRAGNLAWSQGDTEQARVLLEEGLAVCRELGHTAGMGACLSTLGVVARDQGDYRQGGQFHGRASPSNENLATPRVSRAPSATLG